MVKKDKIISYIKKLGWVGFFFFLIKGLTLYVVLPLLLANGLINCE